MKPDAEQRQAKIENLKAHWLQAFPSGPALPETKWITIEKGGLRDRVDLMIDRRSGTPRLGLFDRFHTGIVDLQGCPQMSAELEAWLRDFRRVPVPVERGSVRLRVAPDGMRGVWLDLANVDVKTLLDERKTLDALRAMAVVEIGQKRKRLVERDGQLKLADPVLEPWFETYLETADGKEEAASLYCAIGSFTQPGFRANRALVREAREHIKLSRARTVAEFGSGIGNFTVPLASVAEKIHAYEVDTLALEGLKRTLDERGLNDKVEIHSGNFQVERKVPADFGGVDLVFVDPPRSGLMKFLDPLEAMAPGLRPKHFVYVSCFAESFTQDSARLFALGYTLERISLVDQFPQSRHYETVASYVRK